MNQDGYASRLVRVQECLCKLNLDAVVLMKPRNMFYVTGYNAVIYSRPQYVIVRPYDKAVLIIPRVRETRARRSARVQDILTFDEFETVEEKRDPIKLLAATLRKMISGRGRIGVEADFMPVNTHGLLSKSLRGWETADFTAELQQLRMIKDEQEIENVHKAAVLAEAGMQAAVDAIRSGATEIEVNIVAENAMREAWSDRYSNDDIVGFGDNEDGVISALWCSTRAGARFGVSFPSSTHEDIPDGEAVLVIIWTYVNGYIAEIERTIFKGRPVENRRTTYQVMMRAREKVRQAVRPGAVCEDLVAVVDRVMNESGFRHGPGSVGHGIGLGHHEPPFMVPGQATQLEPGMVLTLEPGILFPDYGVRHSDTVLVTDDECISLTTWDRFTELEA